MAQVTEDWQLAAESISSSARALIAEHIRSVGDLECLLVLLADPARAWSPAEMGRELRVDEHWTLARLMEMTRAGLAAEVEASAGKSYRYAPASDGIDQAVREIARHYVTRRVTVIELIYSKPASPVQSFADAFRLRKERADG